jgi:signal transduction histidine kinase
MRASAPAPFDSLNAAPAGAERSAPAARSLGRVADLKLEKRFQGAPVMAEAASPREAETAALKTRRALRKESSALPALRDSAAAASTADTGARIHTFESEVDSFDSSLLASGELVLFRNVWRDGQRYVQGLLIDREHFLAELVGAPFSLSPLATSSSLLVARHGEVLMREAGATSRAYDAAPTLRGTLLYQSRLAAPFSDFELIFSVTRLPAGAGAPVIAWLSAVLALVLFGGLWLAYRLGARQLALARQQQEFIAAVSHELKTPLTSIRMYGEMLREGWAPLDKRQTYYSFIHDEAERLTRLINNVLNLARMTRNELTVDLRDITVAQLLERVRPTLDSVVAHAARRYTLECTAQASLAMVRVDVDCFTQVILNLLDNALKFSSGEQAVELTVRAVGDSHIDFALRDFGPGITKEQVKRIFALFYRGENALTRATAGTGIGLALVKRLVEVMGGEVRVENREPGAEFCVRLPRSGA